MIRLEDYGEYWQEVKRRIPDLTGVMPVTVDEDMTKKIRDLPLGSITLFWIPPHSSGKGTNVDNYTESDVCIVFVMEKYDPSRQESIETLEHTQQAIERVKALILDSQCSACTPLKLAALDLNTMPETKFFAGFAGWSISFHAKSVIDPEQKYRRNFSEAFSIQFS